MINHEAIDPVKVSVLPLVAKITPLDRAVAGSCASVTHKMVARCFRAETAKELRQLERERAVPSCAA